MCGRYTLTATDEQLIAEFDLVEGEHVAPNANVSPTQKSPVIRLDEDRGGRVLRHARWGLIPAWSKGPDNRFTMINARSEEVTSKPAFREAYRRRRCLVPCNGFYEWKAVEGASKSAKKQKYLFLHQAGSLFALGGMWERWTDPAGVAIDSFTILTTSADQLVAPVHDRMPVIIARQNYGAWLDPALTDPARIQHLLCAGSGLPLACTAVEAV